jgi:hypothetical protein
VNLETLVDSLNSQDLNPDNLNDLNEYTEWIDKRISSTKLSKTIVDFLTLNDIKNEIIRSPVKMGLAYKLLLVHFIYLIKVNKDIILDILDLDED